MTNWTEKNKSLPADMLKLMKTQDVSYIELQKVTNKKKLEREAEELAVLETAHAARTGRHFGHQHILFAADDEEMQQLVAERTEVSEPPPSPPESPAAGDELDELVGEGINPAEAALQKKRALVAARQKRIHQLERLGYKMRLDTQLLAKGRRRKIGTDEYGFAKYKWAPERKK